MILLEKAKFDARPLFSNLAWSAQMSLISGEKKRKTSIPIPRVKSNTRYTGWSDVTESMVTIRPPCCGYNLKWCVAKIHKVIRIKLNQLVYKQVHTITNPQTIARARFVYDYALYKFTFIIIKQRVFNALLQKPAFFEFYLQDGGENQGTKLSHCHPVK